MLGEDAKLGLLPLPVLLPQAGRQAHVVHADHTLDRVGRQGREMWRRILHQVDWQAAPLAVRRDLRHTRLRGRRSDPEEEPELAGGRASIEEVPKIIRRLYGATHQSITPTG